MKIAELKKLLEGYDPEMEIILQKDAEGNGYSPLEGIDGECIYVPESTYAGEIYSTKWMAIDADFSEEDWKAFKTSNKRCLVLFPVN